MRLSVLGGGNSGMTLAGFFSAVGHEVKLFKNSLKGQARYENYPVKAKGKLSFETTIGVVTNDIEEVMGHGEIIFLSVPAYAQDVFFDKLVPFLRPESYLCLTPDNYGGFRLIEKLRNMGKPPHQRMLSLSSVVFACRKTSEHEVAIKGIKEEVKVASINNGVLMGGIKQLNAIQRIYRPSENIFEVLLSNMNPVVHTVTTLMNAGWIESKQGAFDFYGQGISPSVAKVIQTIDDERMAIGCKLDLKLTSLLENMRILYGITEVDLHKALSHSRIHTQDLAPKSLKTRYIFEDVPYGLVPMSEMGKWLRVPTPGIDSIIHLASMVWERNFKDSVPKELFRYLNRLTS